MRIITKFASIAVLTAAIGLTSPNVEAGSFGNYYGGSYGSSVGGSSGGFATFRPSIFTRLQSRRRSFRGGSSGGSSGGGYSVGRYSVTSFGSSGGSSGGSFGGRRFTPVRSLHSWKSAWRARRAARYSASSGGAWGGSSGGSYGGNSFQRVSSYRSHGGSSGGRISYSAPVHQAVAYQAPVYHGPVSHGSSGGSHSSSYGSVSNLGTVSNYGSISGYSGGSNGGAVYSSGSSYGTATSIDSMQSGGGMQNYGETIINERVIESAPQGDMMPEAGSGDAGVMDSPDLSLDADLSDDVALLTVAVPVESATLTVNGRPTTTEGMVRQFMSRGLKSGMTYTYVVDVKYTKDGEEHTETRSIKLVGGAKERLVFNGPDQADAPLETVVKVSVPDDAVVILAGNPTAGDGTERTFRTQELAAGQQWTDYKIIVKAKVGGQMVSKEQTINVFAGSTNELSFDFSDLVAAK